MPAMLGEPLHPVIARRQQEAWGVASWPGRDLRILAIDDALVTHNGLSFHGDGSVVAAKTRKFTPEAIAGATERYASDRDAAPLLDMEDVLCMRPGSTCYGHVLAEIMPGAWLVRKLLPDRQAALLTWSPSALVGLYGGHRRGDRRRRHATCELHATRAGASAAGHRWFRRSRCLPVAADTRVRRRNHRDAWRTRTDCDAATVPVAPGTAGALRAQHGRSRGLPAPPRIRNGLSGRPAVA